MPSVLWWGRFDPEYSRNAILRWLFAESGWEVNDFRPHWSFAGQVQAKINRLPKPDLLWVPCFRQRDLAAARKWADRYAVPLVFDPLISAFDKQVFERNKYAPDSSQAIRLREHEKCLFAMADLLVADTVLHADYFSDTFAVPRERIYVVQVGAEERLFRPAEPPSHAAGDALEVLFYGSFIELQAPQVIIEAAKIVPQKNLRWTLLGQGPLLQNCKQLAQGLDNLRFEDRLAYDALPSRIRDADILLGVFDAGEKAGRVIPNKVYQSLASARPVISRVSDAYPDLELAAEPAGLSLITPGSPTHLAEAVTRLVLEPSQLRARADNAYALYQRHFSTSVIRSQLQQLLESVQSL